MKKKLYLAAGIICALLSIVLLLRAIPGRRAPTEIVEPTVIEPAGEPEPEPVPEPEPEPEPEPYVSPVDFAAYQEINPDIYAWFAIPGTDISYPVLQSDQGEEYYLRRNIERQYSTAGSLFTQGYYNTKTFEDPVTIIYGHRMNDGSMFGQLQPLYGGRGTDFSAVDTFVIFLPDRELHYQIFAAVPHSNEHIMYYYDFEDADEYQRFLNETYQTSDKTANIDEEAFATTDDKIVILATCLKTDRTRRFLVMGKLVETIGPPDPAGTTEPAEATETNP